MRVDRLIYGALREVDFLYPFHADAQQDQFVIPVLESNYYGLGCLDSRCMNADELKAVAYIHIRAHSFEDAPNFVFVDYSLAYCFIGMAGILLLAGWALHKVTLLS